MTQARHRTRRGEHEVGVDGSGALWEAALIATESLTASGGETPIAVRGKGEERERKGID